MTHLLLTKPYSALHEGDLCSFVLIFPYATLLSSINIFLDLLLETPPIDILDLEPKFELESDVRSIFYDFTDFNVSFLLWLEPDTRLSLDPTS